MAAFLPTLLPDRGRSSACLAPAQRRDQIGFPAWEPRHGREWEGSDEARTAASWSVSQALLSPSPEHWAAVQAQFRACAAPTSCILWVFRPPEELPCWVEACWVPQSGCLSVLQLLFEEQGICFAQGSRAIHFVVNGAPHSRNPGGAREHRGTKQQQQPQTAPPPWRPERGKKKISHSTNWPSSFWRSLTPSK